MSDLDAAFDQARDVHAWGRRFGDPNLVALGVRGQRRVLIKQGRVSDGMALPDEAMVAAVSEDLDPGWAGHIYCHLMPACYEIADWRRAGEWTGATARWCEEMPGAGPFMGICRVHRAQPLQVLGAWDDAARGGPRLRGPGALPREHRRGRPYQLGDLRRQRGDRSGSEDAFRAAHGLGRDPQPGLALLRLAQGRTATAASSIRRALAIEGAREGSEELADIAGVYGTTWLGAQSSHARGAVLLADGSAEQALPALRDALASWQELRAPYEAARARVLLARAYQAIGDQDASALELETPSRSSSSTPRRLDRRAHAHPHRDRAHLSGAG